MDINDIRQRAEEIARTYNSEGLSPFPFNNIEKEKKDLVIYLSDGLNPEISGAIIYDKESNAYSILANKNKPETRIQFTIAHELGHYFLHQDIIKSKEGIIDGDQTLDAGQILYRADEGNSSFIEREANNFAASLIMPEKLVKKAWDKLRDVQECAKVFNVSVSAMSIRLEKMHLI